MAKKEQPVIKSIMKEKFDLDTDKVRKLTLNLTKSDKYNVVRMIKHIGKHKQHISRQEMEEALSVLHIPWGTQIPYPSKLFYDAGTSNWNSKTESNDSLLTHTYEEYNTRRKQMEAYYTIVDLSDGVKPNFNGQLMGRNFTPYNLTVLYAVAKVITLVPQTELRRVYDEFGKLLLTRITKYDADSHTDEENYLYIFKYFISNMMLLKGSEIDRLVYFNEMYKVLFKYILKIYDQELNIKLMNDYSKGLSGDYARAFQTKKNIPTKVLEAMKTSEFLKQGFHFVEYDEDTDLNKVKLIAKEWSEVKKHLPKSKQTTELRFRKLGNYRAYGVYFPYINCMSVDLRYINSFVHEYAHHLDYTYTGKVLSIQEEFLDIVQQYRVNWDKVTKQNKKVDYTAAQVQYYTTPTEIFARGYEVYLVLSGFKTNLLKTKQQMLEEDAYRVFFMDEGLLKQLKQYYSTVFK